ncbi:MAG TPA: DedA family protein [Solirubrobacteraceae bacterium]|nr:DedA family protein [Solirubrobacteraceae bacterium]
MTSGLVNLATSGIGSLGLAGVFVLMLADAALIPIPSEAIMLFAGFDVANGRFSLIAVVLAGVLGNLAGSLISYAIGYYGRLEVLQKHGKVIHVSPAILARIDGWFERYGSITVLFGRVIPLVRTYVSLPAGVGKVPLGRFTVLTIIGCIPWVLALALLGEAVKNNWRSWEHGIGYVSYVVAALVVVGVVVLFVRWLRGRRNHSDVRADVGT